MKRELTIFDKLRVFKVWMKQQKGTGLLATCEFCSSTRINRTNPKAETTIDNKKVYRVEYQCMDCAAKGLGEEVWSK